MNKESKQKAAVIILALMNVDVDLINMDETIPAINATLEYFGIKLSDMEKFYEDINHQAVSVESIIHSMEHNEPEDEETLFETFGRIFGGMRKEMSESDF